MVANSIPASAIVSVQPSVINAGGTGLSLSGLLLTNSTRAPIGSILSFTTATAVGAYFGVSSTEAALAGVYFAGFDGSSVKPANLLFAQYPSTAVAAYLRGGSVGGLTLAQLQALSGTLIITTEAGVKTSTTINLAAATSFSNAATLIQAGFTTPGFTVTYDSIASAFLITDSVTGATGSISFATGTLSTPLALTQATGAVQSLGAAAATPQAFMTSIINQTQNFVSFMTSFEPSTPDCVSFAAWTNSQNNRYAYMAWDTDINATTFNPTTTAGYLIEQAGYSGTVLIYSAGPDKAAFAMSFGPSMDFNKTGDAHTAAFRTQAGLTADVTNQQIAANLIANGYNFYGSYATAAQGFVFFNPGQISGQFDWMDDYLFQIQLNNAFQLALMELITTAGRIPYNDTGYGMIETQLLDPIEAALNFGSIEAGVTLSNAQQTQINAAAGIDCAATVENRGWYLSILDAAPSVRAARGSPPCTFIYTSGESIQTIVLSSIEVQ